MQQGRAVHTHIMARTGGRVEGDTYVGGNRAHIGQIFYDQTLITQVTRIVRFQALWHISVSEMTNYEIGSV